MKRIKFGALATLLAGALLFVGMGPASAHRPQITGTTACPGSDHVITWTIGNKLIKPMTITSADAELSGTTYAVTGYTNPVDKTTPTTAETTIPGDLTGTVTITVVGQWPDGITNSAKATVDLLDPCPDTTTTTAPATTVSPTTIVNPPTTNTGPPVSSTPCVSTAVTPCTLAFTDGGHHTNDSAQVGLLLLGLGGVLIFGAGFGLRRRGL